jgi:hypothetical protein
MTVSTSARAGLKLALREAKTAGLAVLMADHVPPETRAVYVPAGHLQAGQPAFVAVSAHLTPGGQRAAVLTALEHHRGGHRAQPDDRARWCRQQLWARRRALVRLLPAPALARAAARGATVAQVAMAMGVDEAAVRWRVDHAEQAETRLVRLELADHRRANEAAG